LLIPTTKEREMPPLQAKENNKDCSSAEKTATCHLKAAKAAPAGPHKDCTSSLDASVNDTNEQDPKDPNKFICP